MKKITLSKQLLHALLVNLAIIGTAGFSPLLLAEEAAESEPVAKAAESEPAAKAEEVTEGTAEAAETRDKQRYSRRYGRGYNRYHSWRQADADARREAMDRYRSARRWWRNPGAESRRQWDRARFDSRRRFYGAQWDRARYEGRRRYSGEPVEQEPESSDTQRVETDQDRPQYEYRSWRTPRSMHHRYRYRY